MTIIILCSYEGCEKEAKVRACGMGYTWSVEDAKHVPAGHHIPADYCEEHAEIVAKEGDPEYVEKCPSCGCSFGVNC